MSLLDSYISYCKVGDWGLGIGDCPIPNPQSPIPNLYTIIVNNKNDSSNIIN